MAENTFTKMVEILEKIRDDIQEGRIHAERGIALGSYTHATIEKVLKEGESDVERVDGGHGTLNKNRKCPVCGSPTLLYDSGFELCSSSECNWMKR